MDVELNRAESELQSEEAALHAELSRLANVSVELSTRLDKLQRSAADAGELAIAERAQQVPPPVDADVGFRQARAAREAALKARRETNLAVRTQLAATKAQLQKLTQQLLADEKTVSAAKARAATTQTLPPPPREVPPAMKSVPRAEAVLAAAPGAKKPQRIAPRVKMQAAVDFNSDNNFFNGFSANISDGGLFVATVNVLPLGTEVDLSFSLPSGEKIEAKGVVRWVREVNDAMPDMFPGIGVQFAALHPQAQSAIDQFLVERDPLFFADAE